MENNEKELEKKGATGSGAQEELKNKGENGSGAPEDKTSAENKSPENKEEEMVPMSVVKPLAESLKKAEDSIVKYKKIAERAKEKGFDLEEEEGDELESKIDKIIEKKIAALRPPEEDETVKELRKANRLLDEYKEALKAKNTASNSGSGNNQDKAIVEKEPNLTPAERALLARHNIDPKKVKL